MKKQEKQFKDLKPDDFEAIGREFVKVFEIGYSNKQKLYKESIIKGVFSGLGGVIGATLAVALLLFVLSLFGTIPLVGPISNNIRTTIENR